MIDVEFDIVVPSDEEFSIMSRWLYSLEPELWKPRKDVPGRIVGITFTDEQDAMAFKLRFRL